MFIAKQFDIIMGVDTHIILIPTPGGPVPTPLPHPFIGIVFDPITFVPIVGSSVWANGLPRGQAGTKVKNAVPHIPMGGPFQKPPTNEGEIQMGSLTVIADWEPCSFCGLPTYTCQDIGETAPEREHSKGSKTKGLVLPTSILLAIPKGGTTGVPTPFTKKAQAKGGKPGQSQIRKNYAQGKAHEAAVESQLRAGLGKGESLVTQASIRMPNGRITRPDFLIIRTPPGIVARIVDAKSGAAVLTRNQRVFETAGGTLIGRAAESLGKISISAQKILIR